MDTNKITSKIIEAAIIVHNELGPGLLESVYEKCLEEVLYEMGFIVETQKPLPVVFRGKEMDMNFRIDLLVNEVVVVELKAVDSVLPIHEAQLFTYLKLSGKNVGLLINFNVKLLKSGIKRVVLDFSKPY
jgi:GxxExxY protein